MNRSIDIIILPIALGFCVLAYLLLCYLSWLEKKLRKESMYWD